MRRESPQLKPFGERAILVEFDPEITEENLEKILFFKDLLEEHYDKVNVEVINTYDSLLIFYRSGIENFYSEVLLLKSLLKDTNIEKKVERQLYEIPVCYEPEFGLDLELISEEKKMSLEEIINLHTHPVYTVFFTGFLPGFLYLGGLDPKLFFSRKKAPRMQVPKGAVGIGEKQTGIYPKNSPGGWQIIGNSPVLLFDKNRNPPCEILAGDKIKFSPVSKGEYLKIKVDIEKGEHQLKKEIYND